MDKALAADRFPCLSLEYCQTTSHPDGASTPATQMNNNSWRSKSQAASLPLASRDPIDTSILPQYCNESLADVVRSLLVMFPILVLKESCQEPFSLLRCSLQIKDSFDRRRASHKFIDPRRTKELKQET